MKEPDMIDAAAAFEPEDSCVPTVKIPVKQYAQWKELLNRLACQTNFAAIELDDNREKPMPYLSSLAMETIGSRLSQLVEDMGQYD